MLKAQSGLQQHLISANNSAAAQALDLTTPFCEQTVHTTRYLEHINNIKTAQQCKDIDEHAFNTVINIPANIIAQISEEFPKKFRQYLKKSLSKDELRTEIISQIKDSKLIESTFGPELLGPLDEDEFYNQKISTAIEQLKLTESVFSYFDENEDEKRQINIDKITEELFEQQYKKLCEDFIATTKIDPDQPIQDPDKKPLTARMYSQNIAKEIEEKLSSGQIDQIISAINMLYILSIESDVAAPLHFIKVMNVPFQETDGQISIFQKLTKLARDPSLKLPAPYIDKITNPEIGIAAKYFKYRAQLVQYDYALDKQNPEPHKRLPLILSESTEATLKSIDNLSQAKILSQVLLKPQHRADYSSPYIGVARFDQKLYYDDIILSFISRSDSPQLLNKILSYDEKPPQEFLDELLLKILQYGYHKNENYQKITKRVIELGAETNQITNDTAGTTLLQTAINDNQIDIANHLIPYGANVNDKDNSGQTTIHYAAKFKAHELIKTLVSHGADINAQDNDGATATLIAAENSNSKAIEALAENEADMNLKDNYHQSALYVAIVKNKAEVIKILASQDSVNQNHEYSDGNNFLHISAKEGCDKSIKALIESDIDDTLKEKLNEEGLSPLHIAAQHNKTQALETLVENGCDIDSKTGDGKRNALIIAIEKGNIETVGKLIELGVNVNQKLGGKKTPLHFAAQFGQAEIAQLLIKKGANIDAKTARGNTPLHVAAMRNKIEVAQALIINKANVNEKNNRKENSLYLALTKDSTKDKVPHYNIADLLLESGSNTQVTGVALINHPQLLISAIHHNHPKAVAKLAPLFATKIHDMKDEQGNLIIYSSIKSGYTKITKILNKKKTDINIDEQNFLRNAARDGDIKAAQYLLAQYSQDPNQRLNTYTHLPINLSTQNNHYEISRALLKTNKVDIKKAIEHDPNILCYAIIHGHTETVHAIMNIIAKNSDLKKTHPKIDVTKYLYLHTAVKNGHTGIVEILINNEVNLNLKDSEGKTALQLAVENNHVDIVKKLLEKKAISNDALLYKAAEKGYTNITQLLLDAKVKIDQTNARTNNPIYIAAKNSHFETLQTLLTNNGNINKFDSNGKTLLYCASVEGDDRLVETLIKAGADINLKSNGYTPLSIAVNKGRTQVTQSLILAGADINEKNSNGNSPLITAILHRKTDIEKILIAAGADVNIPNSEGKFPLVLAQERRLTDIVSALSVIKTPKQREEPAQAISAAEPPHQGPLTPIRSSDNGANHGAPAAAAILPIQEEGAVPNRASRQIPVPAPTPKRRFFGKRGNKVIPVEQLSNNTREKSNTSCSIM